jgi:hypothetical protein
VASRDRTDEKRCRVSTVSTFEKSVLQRAGDLSAKENVNGGTPNQAPLGFQWKYLQSTAFGGVVWGLEGRWRTRAWIGQFLDRRPGVRLTACSTLLVPCQAPGAVPTVPKGVFERSPSLFSLTTRAAREGTPVMAGGTDEGTCYQVSHRTIWLYWLLWHPS